MIVASIIFLGLLFIGFPVAFAMGLSGVLGLVYIGGISPLGFPQRAFMALNSFPFLAIPLFILSGALFNAGGITRRIVKFCSVVLRSWRGSLGHANIMTSYVMTGFTGSATADAVACSSLLIPVMVEDGYSPEFSAGVTAASATIGAIHPPSISLVLYGSITGLSIGTLFMTGIVPTILIVLGLMLVVVYYGYKLQWKKGTRPQFKEVWAAIKDAIWALIAPIIVLGGILAGLYTATEAAIIAVVYALFLGLFVYKEFTVKDLPRICYTAAQNTAVPCTIISLAGLFGLVLTRENFGYYVINFFTAITPNPDILFLVIILMILIVSTCVDGTVIMFIFIPLLHPLAIQLGYNPFHFGMIMVITIMLGSITPPVGMQLYIAASFAKVTITRVLIWPFAGMMLAIIILLTYVPNLVLFIPRLLGMIE